MFMQLMDLNSTYYPITTQRRQTMHMLHAPVDCNGVARAGVWWGYGG